jgi:hypothetical protein
MIKCSALLAVAFLFFSIMHNAHTAEIEVNAVVAPTKSTYSQQNPVNTQVVAYDALYELPENSITLRADVFTKRIHGYIKIAKEGIRYVQHHYGENQTVLDACESLQKELDKYIKIPGEGLTTQEKGLTPVEFILFNMKLALIQEHYPNGYPIDFDQDTQLVLQNESWKEIPFYQFDTSASALHDYKTYRALEYQPDLISQLRFSISALDTREDFALKPYIIYNPSGGFKPSRIAKQILRPDGKHRSLCALSIGTVDVKNCPHGVFERTPYAFLMHDLRHAQGVFHKLSMPTTQKFLDLIQPITSNQNLEDPIIGNFTFLFTHEDTYDLQQCAVDSNSSLVDFFTTLTNKLEQSYITYSNREHEKAVFDPFPEVMKRILGSNFRNLEGQDRQPLGKIEYLPHELSGHYKGAREIIVGDKKSTFEYVIRREGSPLPENPFYEYVEILDIKHIFDHDENPLDAANVEQILAVKGQIHLALTKQAAASNSHGNIRTLNKTLNPFECDPFDVRSGTIVTNLALELLGTFQEKVETLMPGALV